MEAFILPVMFVLEEAVFPFLPWLAAAVIAMATYIAVRKVLSWRRCNHLQGPVAECSCRERGLLVIGRSDSTTERLSAIRCIRPVQQISTDEGELVVSTG